MNKYEPAEIAGSVLPLTRVEQLLELLQQCKMMLVYASDRDRLQAKIDLIMKGAV